MAGVVTYEYDKDEGYRAPAIMSDGIVQLLRQQCSDDGTIQRQVKFTGLVNGQRVTPTKGALVGRVGRFEYSAKRREFALFSLFGREVSVPFKRGDLLAA